jgi:hypothetical protein
MKNNLYRGMLSSLNKVNLSGFERAQAERHLRRAAVLVQMIMGSKEDTIDSGHKAEAPVARQPEKYRAAA